MSGMGRAAIAVVLVPALVLAVSCVGVLDLEGHRDGVDELCAFLEVCYGDDFYPGCRERMVPRVEDADADTRASFLEALDSRGCYDDCLAVLDCLDLAPICGPGQADCASLEQCCGNSVGAAVCLEGRCCSPPGIPCVANGECCGQECIGGTCGGIDCADVGEDCEAEGQCCGALRCGEGSCRECYPEGAPCQLETDCCSGVCNKDPDSGDGRCTSGPCSPITAPCADPSQCCSQVCAYVPATGEFVCSNGECVPEDINCSSSEECCSGSCHPTLFYCQPFGGCGGLGASCTSPIDCCDGFCSGGPAMSGTCCTLDMGFCNVSEECCSGTCNNQNLCEGVVSCGDTFAPCMSDGDCCSLHCDPQSSSCCAITMGACTHPPCVEGEALNVMCPAPNAPPGCIDDICADGNFAHCCCDFWGPDCVMAAEAICGLNCLGM
jgi:hypothetical protein